MKCVVPGCPRSAHANKLCILHEVKVILVAGYRESKRLDKERAERRAADREKNGYGEAKVAGALGGAYLGASIGNMGIVALGGAVAVPFIIPAAILAVVGWKAAGAVTRS
jgi:hypothetical protein